MKIRASPPYISWMAPGDINNLHEARYYEKLSDQRVQCQLCFRRCVISEGERGFCRSRENRGGKLYALLYGRPSTLQVDPIEMEPAYHLIPGHRNLGVATASCNFRCKHCQNWPTTQRSPERVKNYQLRPEEVVDEAIKQHCRSISFSINEPTIFYEYMYDIAKLARARGLKTLFHTNGSINLEPLTELLKVMDAAIVDLKGFTPRFYDEVSEAQLEPVLATLKNIKNSGRHLEIVNLVIPTLNDDRDTISRMCHWIRENLGSEIPLHFNRFAPAHKLTHLPPTPIKLLKLARGVAKESGLCYIYIGNVPGYKYKRTVCP